MNTPDELLAAELRELGRRLDVPEAPDLRVAVRARLTTQPAAVRDRAAIRGRGRRWLVALVAAVVCGAVAVTPARATVVDAVGGLLRFAGIEVRPQPEPTALPATPSPLPLLRHIGLDEARRLARFPVRVPARLGVPEQVTVADPAPDGAPRVVSLSFRDGAVRLDQFDGQLDPAFTKQAGGAEWVEVDGRSALWFPGPHPVTYQDRTGMERVETARLSGPTLVWMDDTVTFRLEGVSSRDEAVEIAASLS